MLVDSLSIDDRIKRIIIEEDSIKELYPPQAEAINRGLLEGKNLVVSIPTAAGKTLLAELAILKHVLEDAGKAVYLCPLRALATEKFKDFKRFERLGVKVAITSGDYDSSDYYLPRYDIIISTNEKFDALLRHGASWIDEEVSLVIVDECHLINDQHRGPTLEILLARLLMKNTQLQLIALSATIGNSEDLSEWLEAELVQSEWRPVPLKEGIYCDDHIIYSDYSTRDIHYKQKDLVLNIALDSYNSKEQVLIFTPSRRLAVSTAKKIGTEIEKLIGPHEKKELIEIANSLTTSVSDPLSKQLMEIMKTGSAFHHAGLNSDQRIIVENSFKEGKIKILCATPTLSAGINLPAKRVVISSVYRYSVEQGSYPIKTLEYKQMCLPENTKVLTPTIEKNIQDLRSGEKIIGYDHEGNLIHDEVLKTYQRSSNSIYHIRSSLGINLMGTGEHPVWTPSGWLNIKELKQGDRIAYINKINNKRVQYHMLELLPHDGIYIPDASWLFDKVKKELGWGKHKLARFLNLKHPGSIHHYRKGLKATRFSWVKKLSCKIGITEQDLYSKVSIVKSAYGNPFKVGWISTDFMWLVGVIASDGNINAHIDSRSESLSASIRISNTNLKILEKAVSVLKSIDIHTEVKTTNNSNIYVVEFGNTLLAKLLKEFGITWKKKSYSVYIPEFFYSLDEELLWAYFSGVFDGDGNLRCNEKLYEYRVLVSSASKKFAYGLHKLLLHLGIVSTVRTQHINNKVLIRGKEAHFKETNYNVVFRKKKDVIKLKDNGFITKDDIPSIKYFNYNKINQFKNRKSSIDFIKIEDIQKYKEPTRVYNIQTKLSNTFFANNFLVHNCGRAGRPQYDTEGESLLIAKKADTVQWLMDRYVLNDAEAIYSKLSAMPALRRSILGLITSKVTRNVSELFKFMEQTFYGFQYEAVFLEEKIREVLDLFIVWEMIDPLDVNENLNATRYGVRVSQLYLDPQTAASFTDGLKIAVKKSKSRIHPIAVFDLLVGTPDMVTFTSARNLKEKTEKRFEKLSKHLLESVPSKDDIEYDFRLRDFHSALFLWDWVNELPVERLVMRYKIGSGDIRRITDTATWLVSAMSEIASIHSKSNSRYFSLSKNAELLSERVKYGIKSDAVSLTNVKGIGRKRARILLDHGIRKIDQLLVLTRKDLSKISGFGPELAKNILTEAKKSKSSSEDFEDTSSSLDDHFN